MNSCLERGVSFPPNTHEIYTDGFKFDGEYGLWNFKNKSVGFGAVDAKRKICIVLCVRNR
ncbi:hypothetical protein DOY81_010740, partial [Sarcophaga bullata]